MKTSLIFTIILLYVINEIFFAINKEDEKKENESKNNIKFKKWETISNVTILIVLALLFICFIIKYKIFSVVFTAIYYSSVILIYVFILINTLLKGKNVKISYNELHALTIIPILIIGAYNLFGKYLNYHKWLDSNLIGIFILKNIVKYFFISFFIAMYIFILFREVYKLIKRKKGNNKKINFDNSFKLLEYEYKNTKGKKGVKAITGFIKDVCILIVKYVISIFNLYILNIIKFIILVFDKILKKITQSYSMYVIIIKTFNISLIASLLITYYNLLVNYSNNIVVEIYSVVITTIIIPIILETINELKS